MRDSTYLVCQVDRLAELIVSYVVLLTEKKCYIIIILFETGPKKCQKPRVEKIV